MLIYISKPFVICAQSTSYFNREKENKNIQQRKPLSFLTSQLYSTNFALRDWVPSDNSKWRRAERSRKDLLLDALDCEVGVERAVRVSVTAAWRRWWEIASLLVNCSIGLRTRGRVYEACVRSALLYEAETRELTSRLMDVLRRCDCRMPRYMAGVLRWQDGRSSSEVAEMCGVEDLFVKLRHRRPRWSEHVKRAMGAVLGEVRVWGRQPAGRPRNKWCDCVMEDMNLVQDQWMWRAFIAHPIPS